MKLFLYQVSDIVLIGDIRINNTIDLKVPAKGLGGAEKKIKKLAKEYGIIKYSLCVYGTAKI